MKKKSIALMAIAVLMVASIATAYTLAFFSDKKEATNSFTVGNVKIELNEPDWQKSGEVFTNNQKLVPGIAIDKAPTIKNTGANDAYVRVKVTINHASVFVDGGKNIASQILRNKTANTEWILVNGDTAQANNTDDTITYVFNRTEKLAANTPARPVFDNITLPTGFDNDKMSKLTKSANNEELKIKVVAEAIQADGFTAGSGFATAADAAFAALDEQGAKVAN